VGPVDTAASQSAWEDGVDDESTPEGGGLPSASVSPVDSPETAAGMWKGGAEAGQAIAEYMAPVSAIRMCAAKRSDKRCIVLVDRTRNDGFLCCARLVQKAKKDKCWRFYMNPQAANCKPGDLTKDTRLGYFGKLEWADPAIKPKTTLQLYDHGPGDGRTDKIEKLSMTMKKKKKHAQWKVRAPNVPGVVYRSQVPDWDKGRKRNVYPGMSLNPQESIKNFLLCKEDLAAASTGSTAGVEVGDNAAAVKAAKDAAVRSPRDTDSCPLPALRACLPFPRSGETCQLKWLACGRADAGNPGQNGRRDGEAAGGRLGAAGQAPVLVVSSVRHGGRIDLQDLAAPAAVW
jgi:hypothetical protein